MEQIKAISSFLLDAGKIIFGSIVIGFFLKKSEISIFLFISGLISVCFLVIIGIGILKKLE